MKRFFNGPGLQFDAYCVHCLKNSTFRQVTGPRGGGVGINPPKDVSWLEPRLIFLQFNCQRKVEHQYHYFLQVNRQAISKIGQSPSLATIASAEVNQFRTVLSKNYLRDLSMAIGLFAHGVGAGSFVYLRRIFEHLLFETAEAARKSGNALSGFETMRMDEKITVLAAQLPEELAETRAAYSVLSAGIHSLSEEQCLSLFPVLKASIVLILNAHLTKRRNEEDKRELTQALATAAAATKPSRSHGKPR